MKKIILERKENLRKISRQSGSVTKLENRMYLRNKNNNLRHHKKYLRNEQNILERKENLIKISQHSGSVTKLEKKQNVFEK